MRRLFVLLSLFYLFFLAGCNTATPVPTPEPTQPPTEAPTTVPTIEPTKIVDYCVDCHTNKEELIANVKPEAMVESESSGAG